MVLYWWLPVAWLARNFARRSSENCCDGWVLRWLPDSTVSYAVALRRWLTSLRQGRSHCWISPRPWAGFL